MEHTPEWQLQDAPLRTVHHQPNFVLDCELDMQSVNYAYMDVGAYAVV